MAENYLFETADKVVSGVHPWQLVRGLTAADEDLTGGQHLKDPTGHPLFGVLAVHGHFNLHMCVISYLLETRQSI